SSLGAMVLGVLTALVLNRVKIPFKGVLEALCLFPLLIPQYFTAIAWVYLLGWNGWVTNWLKEIFQVDTLPFTIYGLPGVIFIMTISYFPLVTLLTLIGLRQSDINLEKAAWLVTSRRRAFLGITFPLITPYILGGGLLVFALALNNFDVPSILLVKVYSLEIFYQFSVFYQTTRAITLFLPILFISLLAITGWYRLFRNRPLVTIGSRWLRGDRNVPIAGSAASSILGGLFLGLILILAIAAPFYTFIRQVGSIQIFSEVITMAGNQILNSFTLALLTTPIVLAIGLAVAWYVERTNLKAKGLILAGIILPLVLPGALLGIGLIKVYNRAGLLFIYHSIFITVIGLTARFLIIPSLTFSGLLKNIDRSLESAARVAGVSGARIFSGIILPLSGRAIWLAGIICFILAVSDLSVSILVNPPGLMTFPIRIYSLFHFSREQHVAALCLIMAALIIILYIIMALLWKLNLKTSLKSSGR
ncbi:MAG: iron ABC transporter permease, partial [Planctomycetes bacterium]|nr:iron ABC transporter permease [Planctomycetota bacterium]